MVLKNLLHRKTRTLLTVLGIAVGVAAVVALGALADGFIAGYGALSGGSDADLLVMQDDAIDIIFSAVDETVGQALAGLSGCQSGLGNGLHVCRDRRRALLYRLWL